MKRTSRIALGGIFGAAALLCLLLTVFPFATYALPALAGLFLMPLVIGCGKKWAAVAYVAVSLLALLIAPDIEAKMLFIAFFGYYPIVKAVLERLHSRIAEWALKLLLFNATAVGSYALLAWLGLVSLAEFRLDGVAWPLSVFLCLFLLAGNVIFILYDIGLTRFLPLYFMRLQPVLHRIFRT